MNVYLVTIGAAMFLSGYVWIGLLALKNDPEYGKWAFLSGVYRMNFCKANWGMTMFPCLATIVGMLLILIGILI
jgi:hypothetical protein